MENQIEVWKDVVGYEGIYKVSNLGKIKSLTRSVFCKKKARVFNGKIMSLQDNRRGYMTVLLRINGKEKRKYVHRLVCESFLNNTENYKQVNHKDGIRNNNNLNNLEYCTASYNAKHSYSNLNRVRPHIGKTYELSFNSKPIIQYDLNMNFINRYSCSKEASEKTNTHYTCISMVLNKKRKKANNFIWIYE